MSSVFISLRLIFSKKQFSYTNISIFLSLFSFMIAIAISILVIGISRAYKNNIELEISNIEPDINIYHQFEEYIDSKELDKFISDNTSVNSDSIIYAKYISSHGMIKRRHNSKGVLVYGMSKDDISRIFNFNYIKEYDVSNDFLFLSKDLHTSMNLSSNEEIYIFNIDKMIRDKVTNGIQLKVTGLYDSNINTFDEKIIFTSIEKARELANITENSYSGLMIEGANDLNVSNKNNLIFESWKEKHYNLLNWLMIFSNPIKLILLFILTLSVIYKIFSFWLILYDKSFSLNYLRILGTGSSMINRISFNIIFILSFFSIICGSTLALLVSYIQNQFQIVKVNPDIYILSKINSIIYISDIIYISLASLFALIVLSRIVTYFRFRKLSLKL